MKKKIVIIVRFVSVQASVSCKSEINYSNRTELFFNRNHTGFSF